MPPDTLNRRSIPFIAVVALGSSALIAAYLADDSSAAIAAKLIASSAFLAVAASVGALQHRYGHIIFAGLALSWIGDMLLLGSTAKAFMAGLITFLLAHVAYIAAFVHRGVSQRWVVLAIVPVGVVSLLAMLWLGPNLPADMVIPVYAYAIIISVMVIVAISVWGAGGPAIIPAGAILFYVSDLSVAAGQFVQTDFPNFVWGLPLYYAGQTLLALSTDRGKS